MESRCRWIVRCHDMPIGGGNIMYPSAAYAPITLYWDTNGTSIGATNSTTATGTWGTNNFWSTDPAGLVATRAWIPGGDAVFSAGSNATGVYTVTVSGLQPVRNITVRNGTITFTTGTLQIAPSAQWYNETSNLVSVTAGIRYTNTLTLKSGAWVPLLRAQGSRVISPYHTLAATGMMSH
jgi:hypothetical protein